MWWTKTTMNAVMLCAVAAIAAAQLDSADPVRSASISVEQFERIHALIRPLPGEYAWRDEIPWETRIQTARAKAAAQDKPILLLASANAFALGRT